MDLRQLTYVAEIVRTGSFTKAAEALHLTQPTISKMVRNLEQELGVQVFAREGKEPKLTEAGEVMISYAEPIRRLFESLEAELQDLGELRRGRVRMGLPPMAGAPFFPPVLRMFGERYPGLAIKLTEQGALKIREGLEEGRLDVGLLLAPVDLDRYESFPIVDEPLMVVLPASHRLAMRSSLSLSELAAEPFILYSADFALHSRIIEACAKAGFEPQIAHESSQWDLMRELVSAGLGVALLPETVCRQLPAGNVKAVKLTGFSLRWRLEMAWRREVYLPLASRAWIDFNREWFQEVGARSESNREESD